MAEERKKLGNWKLILLIQLNLIVSYVSYTANYNNIMIYDNCLQ